MLVNNVNNTCSDWLKQRALSENRTWVCNSELFSAVSPRTYKRESKQRNDVILSKLRADSFTMADPQVPANAVQETQAILQNPAPDEAQALAAPAQAPAQQAQASSSS